MKRLAGGLLIALLILVPSAQAAALGSWSHQPTPPLGSERINILRTVSCTSASSCIALGAQDPTPSGPENTLAEQYSGGRWRKVPSQDPKGSGIYDSLENSTCLSTAFCIAGGFQSTAKTVDIQALVEGLGSDGWTIQPLPHPVGETQSEITGVGCISASSCLAVGDYNGGRLNGFPLAYNWDGSTWRIAPARRPPSVLSLGFNADSCLPSGPCIAVGIQKDLKDNSTPLVESWDGSGWKLQSTPTAGITDAALMSVSCTSQTFCMAIGTNANNVFAEDYDGHQWAITPMPTLDSGLDNVSCASSSSCMAIGLRLVNSSTLATVALHWNGTTWTRLRPLRPALYDLHASSCVSATHCVAVGSVGLDQPIASLVEVWRHG